MNFDYSDEQKFLRDEARRFLASKSPLTLVHEVLDAPNAGHDRTLWRELTEQGWLGLTIPEEYGGLGGSAIDLCALAEEIGRAIAPIPFSSTVYLFTQALLSEGSESQKVRLLPRVAAGSLIGCMATTDAPERPTRSDGERVTGTKLPVVDGSSAHFAIVLADDEAGSSLYVVDLETVGRTAVAALDPTRPIAALAFDGTPAELLGAKGEGREILRRLHDRAAVAFAFEQLGGADRCLEMARDFSVQRFAFGRPIGGFQAIKHKLADMYVQNQLSRSNCYYAAWALAADARELSAAAAAARICAGEAFWLAARESLHVHGGMGFTWDSDCQLFYRRAQHLGLVLGSIKFWKNRLVDQVVTLRAA